MKLLFILAYWHGMAGLHLHTDDMLEVLDRNTTVLGARLRNFAKTTCKDYVTHELKRETEQRKRRAQKLAKAKTTAGKAKTNSTKSKGKGAESAPPTASGSDEPRLKLFNLNTYKFHRLADYVRAILRFGPTDNFTTQTVRGYVARPHHNIDHDFH